MFRQFTLAASLVASAATAEVPHVVTSIPPLQGIVADIMQGAGTPELLLDSAVSPHDFALRPSQLRALGRADVVFYIGLDMERWLIKPLSQQAETMPVALGELANTHTLPARELQDFGKEEHHEAHGDHDEHADEHDHHHHGTIDPHVWLHPENVLLWLDIVSGILATQDPENADLYRANAENMRAEILAATSASQRALHGLEGIDIIVTHDSMQYFEDAFGITVIGAFSASDGQKTGARNASRLLSELTPGTCFVEDANEPSTVVSSLPDDIRAVQIDPLGFDLLEGGHYYPRLLAEMTRALVACKP